MTPLRLCNRQSHCSTLDQTLCTDMLTCWPRRYINGSPGATTAYMRQKNPLAGHKTVTRSDTIAKGTLILSRNKCFEVAAALSPLAAACDAMDAAMLTRKSEGRGDVLSMCPQTASRHWSRGKCGRCLERTQPYSVNSTSSSSYPHY